MLTCEAIHLKHIIVQLQPHLHFSPTSTTGQEPYPESVKRQSFLQIRSMGLGLLERSQPQCQDPYLPIWPPRREGLFVIGQGWVWHRACGQEGAGSKGQPGPVEVGQLNGGHLPAGGEEVASRQQAEGGHHAKLGA